MKPLFSAITLTLFPEMFPGPLGMSLAGTALKEGIWALEALNIRDFATDKHRTVDDKPYGGGVGMVMKPDIVAKAVEVAKSRFKAPKIIYTSPRGKPFNQAKAAELKAAGQAIILCGRFEGVDQRVIDHYGMEEVSLGDFVLSGGEIAAYAILDATVRLLPGVMGKEASAVEESFNLSTDSSGLLEYPHYTRPPLWNGLHVPEVLLSGNHEQINAWRLAQAQQITASRRPDLIRKKG